MAKPLQIPEEVTELMNQRDQARAEKNWKESDRLRDEIEKLGFTVEDSDNGVKIKQIRK